MRCRISAPHQCLLPLFLYILIPSNALRELKEEIFGTCARLWSSATGFAVNICSVTPCVTSRYHEVQELLLPSDPPPIVLHNSPPFDLRICHIWLKPSPRRRLPLAIHAQSLKPIPRHHCQPSKPKSYLIPAQGYSQPPAASVRYHTTTLLLPFSWLCHNLSHRISAEHCPQLAPGVTGTGRGLRFRPSL